MARRGRRTRRAEAARKRHQRERLYLAGLTSRRAPRRRAPPEGSLAWALWRLGEAKRAGTLPPVVAARLGTRTPPAFPPR